MKFALIGAVAVAAAALVAPALAQDATSNRVISNPGYCAQFYPNANCQNLGPGNPYTGAVYDGSDNWRNAMGMQALDTNAYRYHGGPKYND